eukprot:6436666-Alexandrium_andersonii.AAC.1
MSRVVADRARQAARGVFAAVERAGFAAGLLGAPRRLTQLAQPELPDVRGLSPEEGDRGAG